MTYQEFRRQLGKAGLSVKEFAELIKQSPNSITNYGAAGSVPPHLAVIAALMGDMAEHGLDFRNTLSKIEFESCRSRGRPTKNLAAAMKHMAHARK